MGAGVITGSTDADGPSGCPPDLITGRPPPRLAFRPDIAGLRAVAVGLVVLYHAGLTWLPGGYIGVDVFFVISGFLMTSLITDEIERTGRVRLLAFYARRIRRLLPAAVLVLVVTVIVCKLLLAPLAMPDIADAAIATGLYLSNVWLGYIGTEYLTSEEIAPLQHYWSLAVEEQFYLVWPVLLLVAYALVRHRRIPVFATLAAVCGLSLALCVWLTPISQPWAFFSLPTRAWELGAGGLVALTAHRLRHVRAPWARGLSWAGLGTLVATAMIYDEATPFPGWTAALPVVATAAMIAGGTATSKGGASVLLQRGFMQHGGRLSYSLYLWHWPVLIIPAAIMGELGAWTRAGLVGLALGLAWVTYTLVERPVQRASRFAGVSPAYLLGAGVTVAAVAASLLVGVIPRLTTDTHVDPLTEAVSTFGMAAPADDLPANLTPALDDVDDDVAAIYKGCHGEFFDTVPDPGCVFGQPDVGRSVVLIGDSHAAQWFPALERTAIEEGWRLTIMTKAACPAVDVPVLSKRLSRPYIECDQWRTNALARVASEQPDVVIVGNYSTSYRDLLQSEQEFLPTWSDGLTRLLRQLPATSRAIVLGDTPSWPTAPAYCLSANVEDPTVCSAPVAALVDRPIQDAETAAAAAAGATYVPTTPWLCRDRCYALSANVVVYRDRSHVTATFAELLNERFDAVLNTAMHKGK